MKFRDLIARIMDDGADHDWYRNVITGVCQPVPRHREVNELTARAIIKKLAPPHE